MLTLFNGNLDPHIVIQWEVVFMSHQNTKEREWIYNCIKHLIQALKEEAFHSVLSGIALPNAQSISFHEKLGFKKVGQL